MSITLSKVLKQARPFVFWHYCAGCSQRHLIPTVGAEDGFTSITARWAFSGTYEAPTFSPSININIPSWTTEDGRPVPGYACHYFINSGMIQYLSDCTHALAGQTLPMSEFPERDE